MIRLAAAVIAVWISHYSPGVFEGPIYHRLRWGEINRKQVESAECYLAARTRAEVGDSVWVRRFGWEQGLDNSWHKCLVVDVCGDADGGCAWMDRTGIKYEIDARAMMRMSGKLGHGLRVEVAHWPPGIKMMHY